MKWKMLAGEDLILHQVNGVKIKVVCGENITLVFVIYTTTRYHIMSMYIEIYECGECGLQLQETRRTILQTSMNFIG